MSDQTIFETITGLDDARATATVAGDIDKVEAVLASTLCYVHGSGGQEDRALYLKRLREGFYDYKGLRSIRRDFRRFGDVVLVHGDINIHVVVNGAEKDFESRYLQVWTLERDEWKMAAWQSTPLPTA
ncbi:MAG: nuclear transport factor 2 family protein [Burkholderiaceae bacterium]